PLASIHHQGCARNQVGKKTRRRRQVRPARPVGTTAGGPGRSVAGPARFLFARRQPRRSCIVKKILVSLTALTLGLLLAPPAGAAPPPKGPAVVAVKRDGPARSIAAFRKKHPNLAQGLTSYELGRVWTVYQQGAFGKGTVVIGRYNNLKPLLRN